MKPDPRLNAFRADLADARLEGVVESARFVEAVTQMVGCPRAPLLSRPAEDAEQVSEVLFGETLRVFERDRGYVWAQADRDGYVGYLPDSCVQDMPRETSVRGESRVLRTLRTPVFCAPHCKAQARAELYLGAHLHVGEAEDGFHPLHGSASVQGWVWGGHLAPAISEQADFTAVAERFLAVPYLWGGRTVCGVDCSGLVQIAMQGTGQDCPRDSDMQRRVFGGLDLTDESDSLLKAPRKRGVLAFWPGHVGILRDANTLLHASAFHMMVTSEPLDEAHGRIARQK